MERKEFALLAETLSTAYKKENILSDIDTIELWYTMLKDLPYDLTAKAVQKWITTEKWSPSIAEIREAVTSMTMTIPDWSEAWENVIRMIHKHGTWNVEEAMNGMDELTRKCVKRLGFVNICNSENIGVERANFRQIYEAEAQRAMTNAQLPERLRALTEQTIDRLEQHEEV